MLKMKTAFLLVLVSIVLQGEATYDCRRPAQVCLNGGTCPSTYTSATCTCTASFIEYNCGLDSTLVDAAPCPVGCATGSTCWNDGGTAKCFCAASQYGDTCELDRYDVVCTADKMVVGINPGYATFGTDGIAYVTGKRGTAACEANAVASVVDVDLPVAWQGHAVSIPHTSVDCDALSPTVVGTDTTYTREFIVLFDKKLATSSDNRLTVTCTFNHDTGVVVEQSLTVNQNDLSGLNPVDTTGEFSPLTLVTQVDGAAFVPATPVIVGQEVEFTLTVGAEYAAINVLTVLSTNGLDPVTDAATYDSLPIVSDRCMDDASFHVGIEAPVRVGGDAREIRLKIKAFHFTDIDDVLFRFNVRVCVTENVAECDPTACTGMYTGPGNGRKKREASADERVVERLVKVIDPNTRATGRTGITDSECRTSSQMTAGLIAMAIVIFTLLILLTILLSKVLMSRPGRGHSKQDLFSSAQSVQSLPRI